MMFKLMVLQRYYNLSDEQAEFQIVDRTSFRRFLGLADGDRVPDASFVSVLKQRNTLDENKRIKSGEGEGLWKPEEGDSEEDVRHKANKKRHKDTVARWTQKGGQNYFGYKNHIKGDGGDRADQPNLQHVALRANRQAQPAERLTKKQLSYTYIHTNKPSKK